MSQKVLVVDDSGVMRKIIVRSLNTFNISDISEAADGSIAWELFQKESFAMVLTDWNMPNMNGLELLQKIRESGSDVPVILVTTEAERSRVLSAIEAGVNDYVVKPFEPETLRGKLEKFLPSMV